MSIPAPDWLMQADHYNDVDPTNSAAGADHGCVFSVVSTTKTSDKRARMIAALHDIGCRALPYVSFMDTFTDTRGWEEEGTGRLPFTADLADCLLVDKDGRFVNTLMDGTWRWNRYLVCVNSKKFVEEMLKHVQELLDMGADGLFVDNVGPQGECYGHGLRVGYFDRYRTVLAQNPHIQQYEPSLSELPLHTHLDPDLNQSEAYSRFIQQARDLVKDRDPDNVVVLNGKGPEYVDQADGCMYEHFLCSWAWEGRRIHKGKGETEEVTWTQFKEKTGRFQDVVAKGKAVVALSFLGRTTTSIKDDAFFCYAAARLLGFSWYGSFGAASHMGFPWSDDAAVLRQVQLGAPMGDLQTIGQVDYRLFAEGIMAINDGDSDQEVAIPLVDHLANSEFTDVYDGSLLTPQAGALRVTIPSQSGRVYQGKRDSAA